MKSGVTITDSSFISEGEHLKPRGDRLVVKPLDWDASRTVVAIRHGRPVRGKVIAVGPGRYLRIYSKDRSKYRDTEQFIPTQVKPGDIVEIGGLNAYDGRGFIFPEVMIGNEKHFICQEQDVAGIVDEVLAA